MRTPGRIVDASINRAAEALRVMEDAARFLADDSALTAELKSMRHELRALSPDTDDRDTEADVGTSITAEGESYRRDDRAVVTAAAKRLQESLRSLEEWAKLAPPSPGAALRYESLRYRAYAIEPRLLAAMPPTFTGWPLCVLLTESLCARPWQEVAEAAVEGGAGCLQLREKGLADAELLSRARELVALAGDRADVVINDRTDIALAAGARGVHLGQRDLPLDTVRRLAGRRLIVGVSTSTLDEARAARAADYCGAGPMFPSPTKPKPALSGPAYLAAYLAQDPPPPPALAISGITPSLIPELVRAAGGRPFGVAVSSAVCGAADPAAACRALLDALHSG